MSHPNPESYKLKEYQYSQLSFEFLQSECYKATKAANKGDGPFRSNAWLHKRYMPTTLHNGRH